MSEGIYTSIKFKTTYAYTYWREKQYCCNERRKSFGTLQTLQKHLLIHTGEKPFVCETCGRTFRHSKSFKTHMFLHTAEKPYKCEHCNQTFTQRSSLRTHIMIHTGENLTTAGSAGKDIRNLSQ